MSDEGKEEVKDADAERAAHYGIDLNKWTSDAPQPDAEPESEVEEVEPEDSDDKPVEAEADETPEQDEPEQKPTRPDLMDKEVQKAQQLNATLEREIEKYRENASEDQQKRVEKAKSRLDAYLEDKDDLDPYKGVVDIANEVKSSQDSFDKLLKEHEQLKQQLQAQQDRQRAIEARERFSQDYPDLAGRYAEFAQKAHEEVADTFGDTLPTLARESYERAAGKAFMNLVKQAQESTEGEEKAKPKSSAKKPRGSRIVKKQSGTSSQSQTYDPEARMAEIRAAWDKGG